VAKRRTTDNTAQPAAAEASGDGKGGMSAVKLVADWLLPDKDGWGDGSGRDMLVKFLAVQVELLGLMGGGGDETGGDAAGTELGIPPGTR